MGPDPEAGSASKSEKHVSRILPELHANVRPPGEAASGQSQPGNGEQRDGTTVSEQRQKRRRKQAFWELFAGFCGLSIATNSACNVNIQVLNPLDYYTGQDLLKDEEYNKVARTCVAEDVDWVHMAPLAEPSAGLAEQTSTARSESCVHPRDSRGRPTTLKQSQVTSWRLAVRL